MELALDRHSADGSYGRKEPPCPFHSQSCWAALWGALARYGLDGLIERRTFSVFPWSTLVINVSGCFLAGAVVATLVDHHHLPPALRIGLVVGFLGAYTTFSTFAQETVDLAKTHDYALALTNAVASLTIGVAAVLAGTAVGRAIG
jgi:CrcB protein